MVYFIKRKVKKKHFTFEEKSLVNPKLTRDSKNNANYETMPFFKPKKGCQGPSFDFSIFF